MSEIEQCLNCTLLDCVNCLEGARTNHRKYSKKYKREIVERSRNGESVYSIANDTGIGSSRRGNGKTKCRICGQNVPQMWG